jgi:hypothetical protein
MHYLCLWYELKQCIGTMVLSGLELSEVHTCVSWLHLVKGRLVLHLRHMYSNYNMLAT